MNIFTRLLLELQEMALLVARAAAGVFRKPRYWPETFAQMDSIAKYRQSGCDEISNADSCLTFADNGVGIVEQFESTFAGCCLLFHMDKR